MDVLFPRTGQELQKLMADNPEGLIMAGGTDLLVRLRQGKMKPSALFCMEGIEEFRRMERLEQGLYIGAAVTQQQILDETGMQRDFPVLHQALTVLASPPIRHSATLVGNLCTASPAGDTLPPLYALNATVEIVGRERKHTLPIHEFITAPGQIRLQPGEFVSGVIIPRLPKSAVSAYYKVGKRKALAIAIASLAVCLQQDETGAIIDIRLAWGSVGPTVMRLSAIEAFLTGRRLTNGVLEEAGVMAGEALNPIDDIRAGAGYRRQLAANLLLRLQELCEAEKGA